VPVSPLNKPPLPHAGSPLRGAVLRCVPTRHYFLLGIQFSRSLLSSEPKNESVRAPRGT
jgi:hypothetical protein